MKQKINLLYLALSVLVITACKKPFTPTELAVDPHQYLVIEGFINSGNDSTFIHLSRTKKVDTLRTIINESGAVVSVESDQNGTYPLVEQRAGIYASAPLNLDPSHKYRLRIKTTDGKEYLSDFVPVKQTPAIDDIGFHAKSDGLQVYVNTHDANNNTRYYRWDYIETWQFRTRYRSGWISNRIDSIVPRKFDVYDCFQSDTSANIVIANTNKLTQDIVSEFPVAVIPTSSEKIETKYSILVKQYGLTSDAYAFWESLQKNTEKLGSIFDVLPSEVQSNFRCVSNPAEMVIGYLSVGTVSTKRVFIAKDQLPASYETVYPAVCRIDTVGAGSHTSFSLT